MPNIVKEIKNSKIEQGLIVGLLAGVYQLISLTNPQMSGNAVAKGIFRKNKIKPSVGDIVSYQQKDDSNIPFQIIEVQPRKNYLIRPSLANIDFLFIFSSLNNPPPDWLMIDKFLVIAKKNQITPCLIFTKTDLSEPAEFADYLTIYEKLGIDIFFTNINDATGYQKIKDKIATFGKEKGQMPPVILCTGNSGVGKSTFINEVLSTRLAGVGDISAKSNRGKHTTREIIMYPFFFAEAGQKKSISQLFTLPDAFLVDSPGFSNLELNAFACDVTDLITGFVEIKKQSLNCFFQDCQHQVEKNCAVLSSLNQEISQSRYKNYLFLLEKLKENIKSIHKEDKQVRKNKKTMRKKRTA